MAVGTDRSLPDNPRDDDPEVQGRVAPVPSYQAGLTLAQKLVPVADKIRQLNTHFGLRPYRVYLVHVRWTGPARGIGDPEEVSRRELLPTPKVLDLGATSREAMALGLTELGGVRITEVSAKYSEDDLLGRTPDVRRPDLPRTGASQVEFYWEVVQQKAPRGEPAARRRYVPDAAADLKPGLFGWTVSLTRQQGDPARDGALSRSRF